MKTSEEIAKKIIEEYGDKSSLRYMETNLITGITMAIENERKELREFLGKLTDLFDNIERQSK